MGINKITSRMKKGTIIVEVEGFFVERFLNICKSKNIEINDIKYVNNGIIVFKTSSNKYGEIKKVAEKVKCKVKIKKKKGIYFVLFRYRKRRLLFALGILLICILIALSTFVFKIEISGNNSISDEKILEVLKKSGVYVGKNKLLLDTRKAGNQLRTELYDIAWVGVDVKGTKVSVKIVEKVLTNEDENKDIPGDVISNKSGIITKIIAENGTARYRAGSYIEKNMVAIEGVIESEIIENMSVHASGILRVKNTYTHEISKKYSTNEKVYTGKKRYGFGISINNNEYLIKYLPKEHIYDINKKERKITLFGISFSFLFNQYVEYDLVNKEKSYEELTDECKKEYDEYIEKIKNDTSVVSNEKLEIIKEDAGIKYIVTYDLEEDAGEFKKTGE